MSWRTTGYLCALTAVAVALIGVGRFNCSSTSSPSEPTSTDRVFERTQPLMGTNFEIQVVHDDAAKAAEAIDAAFEEIERVESLISEWRDDSELTAVNRRGAEGPVEVGEELFEVVHRGIELSARTDGAFDLTFASCGHLWSMSKRQVPSKREIDDCLPHIDYRQVELREDDRSIALPDDDTEIGLGAIGKGYGVDRGAEVLSKHHIDDFVVDGGGDLRVEGSSIGRPWSVGIAHPRDAQRLLGEVTLSEGAVVTSGDYERYFEADGQRYHHIIDPETGFPATTSTSVTVIADDATTADALATGLFVLGAADGIELADELDGVEAMIVDDELKRHQSAQFDRYFRPAH